MYWIGSPIVIFSRHGWMSKALRHQAPGQLLADPGTWARRSFVVMTRLYATKPPAGPDQLETDFNVLRALEPFRVDQVYIQGPWFNLTKDWISIQDTKRWGRLDVRLADPVDGTPLPAEFSCTSALVMVPAAGAGTLCQLLDLTGSDGPASRLLSLPPQAGAYYAVQLILKPVIGKELELFLVCHIRQLPLQHHNSSRQAGYSGPG